MSPIAPEAPMTLWVGVFQFTAAIDVTVIKIASMIYEHAGESLRMR
ncbi:hypothetical protein [Mycolicibacterium sp. 018/SC-01/001]|nr:hypothetical protein [Mycolicibacterium sp. 018/SC-01/001]